jgi:hypothetical protein
MKRKCVGALMLAVLSATPVAAQVNLLVNPSFELPPLAAGDTFGALGWNDFGGGTFTIKQAPHSGLQALKTFGAAANGVYQQFPALPGQTWTGSVWALNPSFDQMANAQVAAVNIEWHGAGGFIDFETTPILSAASPAGSLPSDYIFGQVSGVAPTGTTAARLVLITGAFGPGGVPGGAPFFDDASFGLAIPEPATMALASLSAVGLIAIGRKRKS